MAVARMVVAAVSVLAGACVKGAQPAPPAPEHWEDGVSFRAPLRPAASLDSTLVLGTDDVLFEELRVGVPLETDRGQRRRLGVVGYASGGLGAFADGRRAMLLHDAGAQVWLTSSRADRRVVHAAVLRVGVGGAGWYRLRPAEARTRVEAAYDVYADLEAVHLSAEVWVGGRLVDSGISGAMLLVPSDRVAVSVGSTVEPFSTPTVVPALRLRPVGGWEVGVAAAIRLRGRSSPLTMAPILQIKGFTHR